MSDTSGGTCVCLPYYSLRNVTSPGEADNGASTYIAVVSITDVLGLDTIGNVREYIAQHNPRKRTSVHREIEATLISKPDRFTQFNGGMLVGAEAVQIDDKKKRVILTNPSVNNGAQTQGEIRRFVNDQGRQGVDVSHIYVRVEISVEPDEAVRTDIAIARNVMVRVAELTKDGARGYFDGLTPAFEKEHPHLRLALSETDSGDEFINTRMLIQVLWALLPEELMPPSRKPHSLRMNAYLSADNSQKRYAEIYKKGNPLAEERNPDAAAIYDYFCQSSGVAWGIYQKWRSHPAWNGTRLRADANQVKRDEDGTVVAIADGVIFPILSALSKFFILENGRWIYDVPKAFKDDDLIDAARSILSDNKGKPMLMGRTESAYMVLMLIAAAEARARQSV